MAGGLLRGAWQPAHSPVVPGLTRPGLVAAPAAASAFGKAVEPHSGPQLPAAPSGTVPGSPRLAGQPAGHPPTQPGDTAMGGTATEGNGHRGTRPPGRIAIEDTTIADTVMRGHGHRRALPSWGMVIEGQSHRKVCP